MIAGSFRLFGGYAIAFYQPIFFDENYTDDEEEFSDFNAVTCSVLGLISSLVGGVLSDRFRRHDPKTKANVCMASSILAAPFITLCFVVSNNFWVSLTMLGFNYMFAEAWVSPAITMLLDSASPKNSGFAVNAFFFFCTLAGTLSTFSLQYLNKYLDADHNPCIYGYTLATYCLVSYLGSVPFFWMAGRSYE